VNVLKKLLHVFILDLKSDIMKKILKTCFGISSLCNDKKHVLFYDADCEHSKLNLFKVENDIRKMQICGNLSTFYILKSTNGYNAFCLDKLDLQLIHNLLSTYGSMVDGDFIKYGFKRGYYTLRIDKDKKFLKELLSYNLKKKSKGHKILFEQYFHMLIENDGFDNSKHIDIIRYPSKKDGFFKGE